MSPLPPRPRTRRLARSAALLTALGLLAVVALGCSPGGDASDSAGSSEVAGSSGGSDGSGSGAVPRAAAAESAQDADTAARSTAQEPGPVDPLADARSVVSTATVSLESDDVAAARFEVQRLVDELRGQVSDEETDGGAEDVRRSRLVLRVPSARFDDAVAALEEVGRLLSSTRSSVDVGGEVIDVEARIRAQEQSLTRVEVLFAQATSIRDVVAVEAQLTRRQAALDSLKQRQAYLADQTSLATITVHLQRTPDPAAEPEPEDADEAGFLPGLDRGWGALTAAGTALATLAGALLPFAVVLALLGVPGWVLLRRRGPRVPAGRAGGAGPTAGQASG